MALFDKKNMVKDSVVVNGVTVRRVLPKFKDVFYEYMNENDYTRTTWWNNLVYLNAYADGIRSKGQELLFEEIEEVLVVFRIVGKKAYIHCNPLSYSGDGFDSNLDDIKSYLLDDLGLSDVSSSWFMVRKDFEKLKKDGEVKALQDSKLVDFVYLLDDLINLEGSKYKTRRGARNKFMKENEGFIIRAYKDSDYDAVMRVRNIWLDGKDGEDIWDIDLFGDMIKYNKELDYRITVAIVDDVIEGVFGMCPLGDNVCCVVSSNHNPDIRGLAEVMWYESLRLNRDMGDYENDGNGGEGTEDGLYKFKMNHRPIDTISNVRVKF